MTLAFSVLMMFLFTAYPIKPVRTFHRHSAHRGHRFRLNEKLLALSGTLTFIFPEKTLSSSWGYLLCLLFNPYSCLGQLLILHDFIYIKAEFHPDVDQHLFLLFLLLFQWASRILGDVDDTFMYDFMAIHQDTGE